jgi:hypothetical protein
VAFRKRSGDERVTPVASCSVMQHRALGAFFFLTTLTAGALGCADDGVDGEGGGGGDVVETGAGAGEPTGTPSAGGGSPTTSTGEGGASTTSTGVTSSTGSGAGGGGSCPPPPACDAPFPNFGPERDFEHTSSEIAVATGFPVHRGRDVWKNPGDPVWIMGKFTYGVLDKDLKDEEVDIWMLRDCGSTWEKLATVLTTPEDGAHPTTEGVEDTGGWVYFQLPSDIELGLGRHRFELVVAGDLSHTPVYVQVVEPGPRSSSPTSTAPSPRARTRSSRPSSRATRPLRTPAPRTSCRRSRPRATSSTT